MKSNDARDFPKRIVIFLCLVISLFFVGTIGFKLILKVSLKQAFIYTIESLALIFHPTSGLAKSLGIFLIIFGVTLIWWILWSIFDMLLEGNLREYLKIRKFLYKMKKMKNHYIIAGGGRVGEEIAKDLSVKKKEYVIIERDIATSNKLTKKGFFVLHGDVSDESVLKKAGICSAKSIVIAMPETEKNLLVTMIAKELNSKLDIYARADKPTFISKLKSAGAKIVVVPETVAAEKFIQSLK